ncbi:hypothetical protein DPMN_135946 [Dreissena polymorpha]|uniref:Uncharacterized protein n=1 Tax=Dreissena polymorpha TaxID=45954 RepID=A0A9D4G2X1_DREPO|nr:hypothetical protein DPMN_135946 [Dreissena polymorpha]
MTVVMYATVNGGLPMGEIGAHKKNWYKPGTQADQGSHNCEVKMRKGSHTVRVHLKVNLQGSKG